MILPQKHPSTTWSGERKNMAVCQKNIFMDTEICISCHFHTSQNTRVFFFNYLKCKNYLSVTDHTQIGGRLHLATDHCLHTLALDQLHNSTSAIRVIYIIFKAYCKIKVWDDQTLFRISRSLYQSVKLSTG